MTSEGIPSEKYYNQEETRKFQDFDGQELACHVVVPVSVERAMNAWMERVWDGKNKLGEVTMLERGEGLGRIGSTRKVTGGIKERIQAVGLPDGSSDKIASISYKIIDGSFPATDHMGFVQFIPDSMTHGNSCLILWEAKFVPSWTGLILCCGGSIVRLMTRYYFDKCLQDLRQHLLRVAAT